MTPEAVELANRRIALLIATDSYADPEFTPLRTPCTDASALAGLLGDPRIGAFEVTTLLNRPAQDVRQVLDETFAEASRDDLVLVHVSGHGLKDEAGKLHLIMSDTRRRALRSSAVAASWVRELIDHSSARRVVVWLDCCFSGAFPPGFTPKGNETVDAIDQLAGDSGRGCAVMTASTKVQYAFEKEQSLFTEAIMSGLRTGAADINGDGLVDASELYSYVYDWVRARTPGQTPTRNDMLSGDFYIAYNRNTLQLPLELPAELRGLLRSSNPLLKNVGIRTLKELAEAGDRAARSALTAMGEEPQQPAEMSPHPPVVVEVPQPLTTRLRQNPFTGFIFAHEIKLGAEVACVALDPVNPDRLCGILRRDSELRWFNARSGEEVSGFLDVELLDAGTGEALALSPDGKLLVHGGLSGIALFDRETRLPLDRRLSDVEGSPSHLAISSDNSMLASADRDAVRVWRLPAELEIHRLQIITTCVAFRPDGRVLAAGHDGRVDLWDLPSGELVSSLAHPDDVQALAFSPDGRSLVTGDSSGVVRSGAPNSTWHPMELRRRHNTAVVSVTFSPTGVMATASQDGQVMFWKPS